MKEELISFETAKLAKEKGFDIQVPDVWNDVNGDRRCRVIESNHLWDTECYAPTQSLLQKWLREKYGIEIQIFVMGIFMDKSTSPYSEFKLAEGFKKYEYGLNADKPNLKMGFDTYEEALEIALEEALKLIK